MHLFILLLFFSQISKGQTVNTKSQFKLSGFVTGKDNDKIFLGYQDENNIGAGDTAVIKNGKFEFIGTVNIVCDAYLWTDLNNKNMSDQSVIRFLLEPGNISISYKEGLATEAVIKGSKTQKEWEEWEKEKSELIITKTKYKKSADSIYLLLKNDSTQLNKLRALVNQLNSAGVTIRNADMNYLSLHNSSDLSGFLLSMHKRYMSVDSIEHYYELLSKEVKKSNVSYSVLNYVYPLSNNIAFRKANPLNGIEFNEKLASIQSVYELSSFDSSGNNIDFKRFHGSYLFIDFWASWCAPCIKEMPDLKKIIKKYQGDAIQFISVSIDTDGQKWKKAIHKNNLNWLQVSELNGFHGLVPTYCKIILGIPQYVLVDKNGTIINSNAPRPGTSELVTLLDTLH